MVGNRQSDALTSDKAVREGVRNPRGYLRKAVSWQKNARGIIVVKTEPATIAEALEEIKRNGLLDGPTGKVRPRAENGEDVDDSFGSTDQTFQHTFGAAEGFTPMDFSGTELWSKELLAGGKASVVLSKGNLTFHPTVETRIVIKHFIPQLARAVVDTTVDGDLEITASSDGAFEVVLTEDALEHRDLVGREPPRATHYIDIAFVAAMPTTLAGSTQRCWDA